MFVWLSTSVFGDYAKLPEHAAAADALQSAVTSLVYELLPCDLALMEKHFDMTLEVMDLASRAIRRFPQLPQRPAFQASLQFVMVGTALGKFRTIVAMLPHN